MTDSPKTGDAFRVNKESDPQADKNDRKAYSVEEMPPEHLAMLEASLGEIEDE